MCVRAKGRWLLLFAVHFFCVYNFNWSKLICTREWNKSKTCKQKNEEKKTRLNSLYFAIGSMFCSTYLHTNRFWISNSCFFSWLGGDGFKFQEDLLLLQLSFSAFKIFYEKSVEMAFMKWIIVLAMQRINKNYVKWWIKMWVAMIYCCKSNFRNIILPMDMNAIIESETNKSTEENHMKQINEQQQ